MGDIGDEWTAIAGDGGALEVVALGGGGEAADEEGVEGVRGECGDVGGELMICVGGVGLCSIVIDSGARSSSIVVIEEVGGVVFNFVKGNMCSRK